MTVVNIQSGFQKTGVYPVNFDAIDTTKFSLSIVTDSKNICPPYVDCFGLLSTEDLCAISVAQLVACSFVLKVCIEQIQSKCYIF